MYITQWSSPGAFSHCCGHPFDCAISNQTHIPLYAPCDCHLIDAGSAVYGNTRIYTSDKKVWTPSGLRQVTFSFTHDNTPPTKTAFKQGELIAHTGTAGDVQGDHSHIDQTFTVNGKLVEYGVTCPHGNYCYALEGSVIPTSFWYVNDTVIANDMGHKFSTFKKGQPSYDTLEWVITNSSLTEPSRPLTDEEMKNNAKCFYGTMNILYGWTLNACCGVLGNMQSESTISPCRWQNDTPYGTPTESQGYGLVQWTPYTKVLDWLRDNGFLIQNFGEGECARMNYEVATNTQWIATSAYPESFKEFTQSKGNPYDLAIEFLANYERPADPNQPIRGTQAEQWYQYLKDWKPVLPGSGEPGTEKKKSKWIYYMGRPF
jgi:hypothetical protein